MKILHIADLHLGAQNKKLSAEKQNIIKNEMLVQVEDLFDRAKAENYDVVLICGDLFHGKSVTSKIKHTFFSAVENFQKPVLYIQGNHDEFFIDYTQCPSNFVILNKSNPFYNLNEFCFWGNVGKDILSMGFDANKKNILLLHGNIENPSDNDYIDKDEYNDFKFSYVAMGHIHQYKNYVFNDTDFVYSGSLFSNGFDECGIKGYVEVNIDKEVHYEFIPFAKRKHAICECDISNAKGYYDLVNKIRQKLLKDEISVDDLVKVILTGYYDENFEKNTNLLSDEFAHYFYFTIEDKSKMKIDIDKYKNETLSFKAEFIKLVESEDIDESMKNLICTLGIESLKGEDLSI